jgi:hypothetical protein
MLLALASSLLASILLYCQLGIKKKEEEEEEAIE